MLYGHDESVSCVAVAPELDLVASGSDDGTIILHTLREGKYIRSITSRTDVKLKPPDAAEAASLARPRIHWVGVGRNGWLCSYSHDDTSLCTHTINGRLLARRDANERLFALAFSEDGNVLLTGGEMGKIMLRWARTLELAEDAERKGFQAILDGSVDDDMEPFSAPIKALRLTRNERHLLVGLASGELRVLAHDSDYLRQRLQNKLEEIGIL
jgi:WD40 repeat protein